MQTPTTNMLSEGTVLNGTYRIESHLASGGFGNTYIATHLKLNKKLVVKEFFMKGVVSRSEDGLTVELSNQENKELLESQKKKFKKEAQRLATLESKYIVHVYDLFEENNTVYYTMDYLQGKSLRDIMEKRTTPLNEGEFKKIVCQLTEAIDVIHKAGILHMDIKPGNIMLTTSGYCVLIDFGASKQITAKGDETTSYDLRAFTNLYAPPEQINGTTDQWGPWTDFYALGATLYYCLTKKNPPSLKDIYEHENDVFSFSPDISRNTTMLIKWLMSPKTSMRPQNITAIRNYISAANNTPPSHKERKSTVKGTGLQYKNGEMKKAETTVQKKRNPFIIPGIALFALVVLLVIFLTINNEQPSERQKTPTAPDAIENQEDNDIEETDAEAIDDEETIDAETELDTSETEDETDKTTVNNNNNLDTRNNNSHINDEESQPLEFYEDDYEEPEIPEPEEPLNVATKQNGSKKENDKKEDRRPVPVKPNPPKTNTDIVVPSPSPQPERSPNDDNTPKMQDNTQETAPLPVPSPAEQKKMRMQRELNRMNQEHTSY